MAGGAPRVLILADCGFEVGGGHVMRCLALAQALMAGGAACAFMAPPAVAQVLDAFAPPGVERQPVPEGPLHELVEASAQAAQAWGASAVLVDHYGIGALQEQLLQRGGRRLLCIDDLAERPHSCELLIDPTLDRTAEAYRGLVPAGTSVLTGPCYALLRPEYAETRTAALARRRPADAPRRLLVSLGLMDLRGIIGRVMNLLGPQLGELEVDIAVGARATTVTWLKHLAGQNPRVKLHLDARNMAELIAGADIGIGAGGASTWERATLGLPSLSLILAANQEGVARALDRQGATIAVDARDRSFAEALPPAFERLRTSGVLRTQLSATSAAVCDGQGTERAAEEILALLA